MPKLLSAFSSLLVLTLTATAHADSMYSNAASFAAAASNLTEVTFSGLAPSYGVAFESNGFTTQGATFSSSGLSTMVVADSAIAGTDYSGGDVLTFDYLGPSTLTIDLPSSNSVAFDFGSLDCLDSPLTITLSDGYTTTIPNGNALTSGSLDFVGFTSSAAITSVTLSLDGISSEVLDDVEYGKTVSAAAATPEPGSLLLAATGMVGAAGALYSASKRQLVVEHSHTEETADGGFPPIS